jgi:hypothetical protein
MGLAPQLSVAPARLDWASGTSDWQTIRITNAGGTPSGALVGGFDSGGGSFEASNTSCGARLEAGASCEMRIRPRGSSSAEGSYGAAADPGGRVAVALSYVAAPPPYIEVSVPLRCVGQRTNGPCSLSFNIWDYFSERYPASRIDFVRVTGNIGTGTSQMRRNLPCSQSVTGDFSGGTGSRNFRVGGGKWYQAATTLDAASGAVTMNGSAGGWGDCGCRACIDTIKVGIQLK